MDPEQHWVGDLIAVSCSDDYAGLLWLIRDELGRAVHIDSSKATNKDSQLRKWNKPELGCGPPRIIPPTLVTTTMGKLTNNPRENLRRSKLRVIAR